jgi:hypothetical protein
MENGLNLVTPSNLVIHYKAKHYNVHEAEPLKTWGGLILNLRPSKPPIHVTTVKLLPSSWGTGLLKSGPNSGSK